MSFAVLSNEAFRPDDRSRIDNPIAGTLKKAEHRNDLKLCAPVDNSRDPPPVDTYCGGFDFSATIEHIAGERAFRRGDQRAARVGASVLGRRA